MATQSKLTLLLELKNKLFNNALMKTKQKLTKNTNKMKKQLDSLKVKSLMVFKEMRNEIPLFGRALDVLGNPYLLIIAGIISLGVLMSKATTQAKLFNKEFRQIQNLNFDKSGASIQKYKNSIRDAAFEMGTNLQDSTRAFYDLQSATGLYGKSAELVFKKVAKYSVATGANLNESVNATTKAMKAFGLGVDDIDGYLTSNAKAVAAGITTYSELAKVQTEFGGAAAGAGQNIDTANKLFAVFTSIASSSATAATMTKSAFEGLTQANTVKGLKNIGISLYTADGKMRNLEKILTDVSEKFKTMTPEQIDQIINKIGGPEGLRNMFVKLKTDADGFKQTLDAFNNSSFDLDKAFNNAKRDLSVMSEILGSKFNTLMARLGERLIPMVISGINAIIPVLDFVYKNFDSIMDVIESIAIGAGVFAALKISMLATALVSGGLTGALAAVKFALFAIRFAIFQIPIVGWIALAISGLVLLYKKWDGFRAVIDASWAVIKSFFSNMWEGIKQVVKGMVGLISGAFKLVKAVIKFDFEGAKEGVDQMKQGFKDTAIGLVKTHPLGNIATNYKQYGDVAGKAFNKTIKEGKLKAKEEGELGVFTNSDNTESGNANVNPVSSQISKVTSSASNKPQTTNVNFESVITGGVHTAGTEMDGLAFEDMEEYLTSMMQRVIYNLRTT